MGFKELQLQLPTDTTPEDLRRRIQKELKIRDFTVQIDSKSLDARKRSHIHWLTRVTVLSKELPGPAPARRPELEIPAGKRQDTAVVVGTGPAGFFSALVLQKAGVRTTIVERGADVDRRAEGIERFEKSGAFSPVANYAFGEGGAGTFSDGKLTSRTKNIALEKEFILASYIRAGAPDEIAYLAHPHLGSDNLRNIVRKLRVEFESLGGKILFETRLEDLVIRNGRVTEAVTSTGNLSADHFVIATGHSAHDTYRMLIRNGVQFKLKNFAIGCRMEHPQELINSAQWGHPRVAGLKAAEYRLTSEGDGKLPVYSFCMCPGGVIVPATASADSNIVNGMSNYPRDGRFANAGCVAGIQISQLLGREVGAAEALDWLGALERKFFDFAGGYAAPACRIEDFLAGKPGKPVTESSYPLGLKPAPLWELLPIPVSAALREGLKDFSRRLRGFEKGSLLGLESKTSSPIQVIKNEDQRCAGFENLYLAGEASGFAGGIISSGTHGIKIAMTILGRG